MAKSHSQQPRKGRGEVSPHKAGRAVVVHLVLLGVILTGALFLRLAGIWRTEPINYHPDDWVIARPALQLANDGPAIIEKTHYKWPACAVLYPLGLSLYGMKGWWGPYTYEQLLIIQRVISAVAGTLAVLVAYLLMKKMFSVRAGLLAAAFLAVAQLPVQQGHYGTVTETVSLIVLLIMLLIYRLFGQAGEGQRLRAGTCVVLGLLWGLGIAAKWTLLLGAIPISGAFLLAWLAAAKRKGASSFWILNLKRAAIVLPLMTVGFVVGMPDVMRWPDKVVEGLTFEMEHHQQGHWGEVTVDEHGLGHRTGRTMMMMARGGGIYLGIAGGITVLFCLRWLTHRRAFLLWTMLVWLTVVNRNAIAFERHYLMPFIVMLLIVAAALEASLANRRRGVRVVGWVVCVFLLGSGLLYTCICISPFWQEEARLRCSKWIQANVTAGSGVTAAPHTPMWLNPAAMVSPDLSRKFPRQASSGKAQYLIVCARSLRKFAKHPPWRAIVPSEWFPQPPPPTGVLRLYEEMIKGGAANLRLVKEFRARPSFLGLDLRWFARAPDQDTTFANQAVSLFLFTPAPKRPTSR